MSSKLSSERGAILIQVAVASIVLIAFTMFVVDYGIMWVSRGQAQNAADSGALAGAVALAFDDFDDRTADGPAKQAALNFALSNKVFGEDPDVQVDTDIIFYDDDPTKFPESCADDTCIRVDVYRTDRTIDGIARSNPLPMMFGQLVGLNTQGVRATATAQIYAGNAAECVKPWVVADRWSEGASSPVPWNQSSHYSLETDAEPDPDDGTEPGGPYWDTYTSAASDPVSFTGFGATDDPDGPGGAAPVLRDFGYQFILRMENPGGGGELGIRSPGWVMTVNLPNAEASGGGMGTSTDIYNISGCTEALVAIADPDDPCDEASSIDPEDYENEQIVMTCLPVSPGNAWNPQEGALRDWIAGPNDETVEDLDDVWLKNGANGGVGEMSNPNSRRIIPLALFDPAHYASHDDFNGSNGVVKIVNVLGFFVEGTCEGGSDIDPGTAFFQETYLSCSSGPNPKDLVGRLVSIPGVAIEGAGNAGPASFTRVIRLVR
jgi:hypothetical protein